MDLFVKRLNLAVQLDGQRIAFAVNLVADGHLDPAFADAVLLNMKTLLVVEANANVMFKDRPDMMRAARISGEAVRQGGLLGNVVHGAEF